MENGKANSGSNPKGRPRVVVVGSGFAGFTCARELERRLRTEDAELIPASPWDYLLYGPLLPEVATGASAPEDERLMLTVERLGDGEVNRYLTDVLMAGDKLELRGPIGGYFVWETADGGPLLLVGGGSGITPLMAMIRHRAAAGSDVPTRLRYSSRFYEEVIFREKLETLASRDGSLE